LDKVLNETTDAQTRFYEAALAAAGGASDSATFSPGLARQLLRQVKESGLVSVQTTIHFKSLSGRLSS